MGGGTKKDLRIDSPFPASFSRSLRHSEERRASSLPAYDPQLQQRKLIENEDLRGTKGISKESFLGISSRSRRGSDICLRGCFVHIVGDTANAR